MRALLLSSIRFYQRAISPGLGARCRFEPSCSQYAYEAVESYGSRRGMWLAAKRLLRCRPGVPGGYDPVPERPGGRVDTSNVMSGQASPGAGL